ncbi:TetR/AcrR family transcriptional regulator [Oceanospirillum sediminis]|uniref:TetR/AcrR family transcriptional regulator n=1 Tax=Oceanospirillum sediminis TaxID=2760088 RepID=A0A839IL88_9GAMM|nr:TetR/AcrR family transcriptional regulator [Oceanospirillum sediminis]MBB1486163.1 TetR/AcrR family transcriptional regulator [Oceanospirillum sediminis]
MARPKKYQDEQVLDSAMEAFWQNGFKATSAQDLVNATGLPRSSLYNTFKNKQGLFEQALVNYQTYTQKCADKLDQSDNKKEAIHALLVEIVNADLVDETRRGCFVTNTAVELGNTNDQVNLRVRQNLTILENALTRNIKLGQQSGSIRSEFPADVLATCILTTIQGLRVLSKASQVNQHQHLMNSINVSLAAYL